MSDKKVWLVTGAGRGMGVDLVQAGLAAGHAVVATGRDPERVASVLGAHDDLLVLTLDVTSRDDAKAAVQTGVDRFGRIDVLVNNAGNFNAGFFEELSPQEFRAQIETTLFGPVNVTAPCCPSCAPNAPAWYHDLINRRNRRRRVPDRVRRIEVRGRGLDGVVDPRGRAVRHPHHARRARLLPHRAAQASIDDYAERTAQNSPLMTSRRYVSRPAPTPSRPSKTGPSCSELMPA
jgi:NAD(P)-dependent dehydrogenase (short-subunit alcohol dehydrogenase family)